MVHSDTVFKVGIALKMLKARKVNVAF